jgi:hypothetical protein
MPTDALACPTAKTTHSASPSTKYVVFYKVGESLHPLNFSDGLYLTTIRYNVATEDAPASQFESVTEASIACIEAHIPENHFVIQPFKP